MRDLSGSTRYLRFKASTHSTGTLLRVPLGLHPLLILVVLFVCLYLSLHSLGVFILLLFGLEYVCKQLMGALVFFFFFFHLGYSLPAQPSRACRSPDSNEQGLIPRGLLTNIGSNILGLLFGFFARHRL